MYMHIHVSLILFMNYIEDNCDLAGLATLFLYNRSVVIVNKCFIYSAIHIWVPDLVVRTLSA